MSKLLISSIVLVCCSFHLISCASIAADDGDDDDTNSDRDIQGDSELEVDSETEPEPETDTIPLDCAGVQGGSAKEDNCGTCDDDPNNDCDMDCAGNWSGEATVDRCGTCDANPDNDCAKVFIAGGNGEINVVNGATQGIIQTLQTGAHWLRDVAVHPDVNKIYVAETDGDRVVVIDGDSLEFKFIKVGREPHHPVFNGDGTRVYVTNYTSDSVSVIDTNTDTVIHTIAKITEVTNYPDTAAFNTATNKLYVACLGATVVVIDAATNTVSKTITGFDFPYAIAINSSTNKIYVANRSGNTIDVIDGHTDEIITGPGYPIAVAEPWGLAVNETDNLIYVASSKEAAPALEILNGKTDTLESPIALGYRPYRVAYNAMNDRIYLTFYFDDYVQVLDAATLASETTIELQDGTRPLGVAAHMYTYNM